MSSQLLDKMPNELLNEENCSNFDIEDLTNSSIIEFLKRESECFNFDDSDVDVESLFEEINKLTDKTDERSVEDILKEAELLISKQSGCGVKYKTDFEKFVTDANDESILSKESTPRDLNRFQKVEENQEYEKEEEEQTERTLPSVGREVIKCLTSEKLPKVLESSKNEVISFPFDLPKQNLLINIAEKSKEIPKNELTSIKNFNEPKKTINILPKNSADSCTSPIDLVSSSNDYLLQKKILTLKEDLKDNEERFQSLKIQHDTLSYAHRDLRESNTRLQEEYDSLKIDVQHLTECANILRTELLAARNDRDEALKIQNMLKNELEEARIDKKKYAKQSDQEAKKIQDLQRQCKEMEKILARKYPDSVSALIVTSKNSDKNNENNSATRHLLEQRIAQVEADAREQDNKSQEILSNIQTKFNSVQLKYETHIADLETQVLSLQEINTKLNEKLRTHSEDSNNHSKTNFNLKTTSSTQTIKEFLSTSATQTDIKQTTVANQKGNTVQKKPSVNRLTTNFEQMTSTHHAVAKEDAHLLATIRGMRVDLAVKEKGIQRLTRELDDCKKTIRKLQKDKEAMKSDRSINTQSGRKNYDPNNFVEQSLSDDPTLKEALNKIKTLEHDYKALQVKRVQDLKTLQSAHEREQSSSQETMRMLQGRLSEREEATTIQKHRKIPIDYFALKAKVSSLEKRHVEREQRLHLLVDALGNGRVNGVLEEILSNRLS